MSIKIPRENRHLNIWNPFIPLSQAVEQEEPLDLSLNEKKVKNKEETFDFAKFFHTYYTISSRSLPAYPSYELHSPPQTSPTQGEKEERTFIQHL